jgi:hypothetical protein
MVLNETSRRAMQTVLSQHKAWLAETTKFVTAYGGAAPTDCDLEGTTSNFESRNFQKAERALEEKLRALVADLELVMAPLLGPESRVYGLLQSLMGAGGTGIGASQGVLREANASLQLLVDTSLQSLPWEALQVAGLFQGRVGRDFSLHMLHHRMQTLSPAPAQAAGATPAAAAAAAAASAVPQVVTVTASGLKYIVDPMQEDEFTGARMPGLERDSLSEAFKSLTAPTTAQGMLASLNCFMSARISERCDCVASVPAFVAGYPRVLSLPCSHSSLFRPFLPQAVPGPRSRQ